MGSPETESGRGAFSEDQVAVTLTHSFLMQEKETTQAEWTGRGLPNPSARVAAKPGEGDCLLPECPVGSMTWFEALAYANAASESHDPPLEACFRLTNCAGELGRGLTCEGFELTTSSVYDCRGFRLPTEAEWEYAARAGTRTPFYSGDLSQKADGSTCYAEPALDAIAWYCANSAGLTHPTGEKRPNGWGLFDLLGNAFEWVHDTQTGATEPGPLTNPGGTAAQDDGRQARGGNYFSWPTLLRAASGSQELSRAMVLAGFGLGFRLVRTVG